MKIGFVIGETEQHQMELTFDQLTGDLTILMDGTQVLQDSPAWAAQPTQSYEFSIGDAEKHRLAFQLSYGHEPTGLGTPLVPRLKVSTLH